MSKTLNQFSIFIALGNIFCINRNYLLEKPIQKMICNFIFLITTISVICVFVFEIASSNNENIYASAFHLILLIEVALLMFEAKTKKASFEAIKRLDEKCDTNDEQYNTEIKTNVGKITPLATASLLIDIVGLFFLETKPAIIFILTVLFAAHESEMLFYSTFIEIINLRLSNLKEVNLNYGSKVYRHVLIASSHFNEEFSLRILVMLGMTIITTVLYSLKVILADNNLKLSLTLYLIWRELKSLYAVWLVCYAAARTESICNSLGFYLARRLSLDPSVSKGNNPKHYNILKRWYNTMLNIQPRFINTSVLSIGLSVPLNLIDISINYVLIIVQMYMAYK